VPAMAWFLHSVCNINFDEPVGSNARRLQEASRSELAVSFKLQRVC